MLSICYDHSPNVLSSAVGHHFQLHTPFPPFGANSRPESWVSTNTIAQLGNFSDSNLVPFDILKLGDTVILCFFGSFIPIVSKKNPILLAVWLANGKYAFDLYLIAQRSLSHLSFLSPSTSHGEACCPAWLVQRRRCLTRSEWKKMILILFDNWEYLNILKPSKQFDEQKPRKLLWKASFLDKKHVPNQYERTPSAEESWSAANGTSKTKHWTRCRI